MVDDTFARFVAAARAAGLGPVHCGLSADWIAATVYLAGDYLGREVDTPGLYLVDDERGPHLDEDTCTLIVRTYNAEGDVNDTELLTSINVDELVDRARTWIRTGGT